MCGDQFIQAELQQAKVSGQYTFGEEGYPAAIAQKSSLTSQQVQEQLAQAIDGLERLSANGLRYPIPPYGVQMDVRAGMARSYSPKAG